MAASSFAITVGQKRLDVLRRKLDGVTWPDELENSGWDYGVPLSVMKRLVDHWKSGYDWRAQEHRINNALPQFVVDINVNGWGALNIHFVHKRSSRPNAIPLLFCHGWPGSFLEIISILPLLTEPESENAPAFHVVAPSHPGFTFSEAPKKRGFKIRYYAEVQHKLMQHLGYTQYATQGGDWGSTITRAIGSMYSPNHCKASHFNMHKAPEPSIWSNPSLWLQSRLAPYSEHEKAGLERSKRMSEVGFGYYKEQATRPQTLGYSLADSPVGLLAWIYEKLHDWTDNYPWTDDEVLTWVSLYWFSRAGPTASLRIYFEYIQSGDGDEGNENIPLPAALPVGLSYFPQEIIQPPRAHALAIGNVVFEGVHDKGGHFAAYEQPHALAQDLRTMFGRGGAAYGVVEGANGY